MGRYRDPVTGKAYADLAAFKILRQQHEQEQKQGKLPAVEAGSGDQTGTGELSSTEIGKKENETEDAEGVMVPQDQLELLGKDPRIKQLLGDPDLAKIIKEVDSAKDRHRALAAVRSNPKVGDLIGQILQTIEFDPSQTAGI
mmetsp:Transcript_46081/g.72144  ORF Transcript_46081/g.72144 Transcript_46081/m.72144 type:complete len:142 (+) Transcript_46081:46-471(+)